MAATAILFFIMETWKVPNVSAFGEKYLDFKFDDNPSISSKVTVFFQNLEFGWDFSTWVNFEVIFRVQHPHTLD